MPSHPSALSVSMHPWVWLMIVRRAVMAYTDGDLNLLRRRVCSRILRAIESEIPIEDTVVECPTLWITPRDARDRERRNAEILGEDPTYGRFQYDEVVGGKVVVGFHPLPRPDLRNVVVLHSTEVNVAREAVDAYAKKRDLDHSISDCLCAAYDALDKAKESGSLETPA